MIGTKLILLHFDLGFQIFDFLIKTYFKVLNFGFIVLDLIREELNHLGLLWDFLENEFNLFYPLLIHLVLF